MAQVFFTSNLRRHVDCPEIAAPGTTVREVLEEVFASHAQARGYVLDDQAALRKHMTILVDGRRIKDRYGLTDPVRDTSQIYILQALSGG